MSRTLLSVLVAGLVASFWLAPEARAEKKKVVIVMTWNGSVADDNLQKDAPMVIADAETFDKIWKTWKATGATPGIDFKKFIVVAVYSPGSRLNLAGATLDDAGNLELIAMATADFGTGFRYVLGVVSRESVRSVNGKQLPK